MNNSRILSVTVRFRDTWSYNNKSYCYLVPKDLPRPENSKIKYGVVMSPHNGLQIVDVVEEHEHVKSSATVPVIALFNTEFLDAHKKRVAEVNVAKAALEKKLEEYKKKYLLDQLEKTDPEVAQLRRLIEGD